MGKLEIVGIEAIGGADDVFDEFKTWVGVGIGIGGVEGVIGEEEIRGN